MDSEDLAVKEAAELERLRVDETLERFFHRKRDGFIEDHELRNRPALLWQCMPCTPLALEVSNEKIREAMRGGGADDGWWEGFRMNGPPRLAFEGLTSVGGSGDARWATELHVDGYLAAGIWTFPELRSHSGEVVAGVADYYADAFLDFVQLARGIYEAAQYSDRLRLTCSMHLATRLVLLGGRDQVIAPAPKRSTLRWPIVATDVAGLGDAGVAMAAQFLRAYGKRRPQR